MKSTIRITLSLVLSAATLAITASSVKAQESAPKAVFGAEGSMMATGSGTGMQYTPSLYLSMRQMRISGGINFQAAHRNISGYQLTLERKIANQTDQCTNGVSLFWFMTSVYQNNGYLSGTYLSVMKRLSPEAGIGKKVSIRTFEQFAGFGLRKECSKLWISGSVGFGGYITLNKDLYSKVSPSFEGTRAMNDLSIMFRLAIGKRMKKDKESFSYKTLEPITTSLDEEVPELPMHYWGQRPGEKQN